jgi:hypothetical protein
MCRFVGSGVFCVKICDNTITSPDYCLNTYDLVGCDYNMPSNAQNGTYTSCDGDVQDVVGIYSVNGVSKLLFCLLDFFFGCVIFIFSCSLYLVDACNVSSPSSLHTPCSCFVELPDFPSHRSLRGYIHRKFIFLLYNLNSLILL